MCYTIYSISIVGGCVDLVKKNLFNFICLLFLEFVFALVSFKCYDRETIISVFIYCLFISSIITLISSFFNYKVNKIIACVLYGIIGVYFSIQLIFLNTFNTVFSISLFKLTDQVLGFGGQTISAIFSNILYVLLFFIPLILNIVCKKKYNFSKLLLLSYIGVVPILYMGYCLFLGCFKDDSLSIYSLYHNVDNQALELEKLGVFSTTNVDIYRNIFGFDAVMEEVVIEEEADSIFDYDYNNLEIQIDDGINANVKSYIESNSGTKQNLYTGIFKNKNLIFIVAESFSEIGISEDLTPTLYKLTNSGFKFNNFYSPHYLSTIGGEFQALTGLYPNADILSIWRDGHNSFPYSIVNLFRNSGYNTYAYHDHNATFQDRNVYLKTLGFDNFKACYQGLNINCRTWPESDIEMINNTILDYVNSEQPFFTYYMTVSGHMAYNFSGNYIASKNKDLVNHLSYSTGPKAYVATQIELDRALQTLIDKLSSSGKLDDTVIVMVADHYPYGLSLDEVNELSTYKRDEVFGIDKNSLIIWNSKLKNISIDKTCMSVDIVPTLFNLFGIPYDSRLYAGNDIMSSKMGLAVLGDGSWITDLGKYNSSTRQFSGQSETDYINSINSLVNNMRLFSKDVIKHDAYKYIKLGS